MRPQTYILLALVVVVGAAALYFGRSTEEPTLGSADTGRAARADEHPEGRPAVESPNSAIEGIEDVAPSTSSRRMARVEQIRLAEDSKHAALLGPNRTVAVEVVWPSGARPSGPVDIFVFDMDHSGASVLRAFDSAQKRKKRREGAVNIFDDLGGSRSGPADIRRGVIAVAPVEESEDGTWRATVEVPERSGRVFVHALGSTYLTDQPTPVDPGVSRAIVRPSRGAQLAIEISTKGDFDVEGTWFSVSEHMSAAELIARGRGSRGLFRIDGVMGPEGRIVLETVPAGTPLEIATEHDLAAADVVEVGAILQGTTGTARLTLVEGGSVSGLCVDANDVPLAGATVVAKLPGQAFGFDDAEVRDSESDADGRFTLRGLADGGIIIRATKDGYLESSRETFVIKDGEVEGDIVLHLDGGKQIAGTVSNESGDPLANCEVTARFDIAHITGPGSLNATRGTTSRATTDASGTFVLSGLGGGPFTLIAELPSLDEDDPPAAVAREDGVRPGASDVQLVVRAPLAIAGSVVDDQSVLVAGVRVLCSRLVKGSMGDMRLDAHEALTDATGAFSIDSLQPGLWELSVMTETHVMREHVNVDLTSGGAEPITLVAGRASSVSGLVLAPDGNPLEGAKIYPEIGTPRWQASLQRMPTPDSTHTAADGTFTLFGLPAGAMTITARKDGFARVSSESIELAEGEKVSDLTLRLSQGGAIEGVCFDDEGNTASNRIISINSSDIKTSQTVAAEADGTFRVEGLTPGTYQISSIDPELKISGEMDVSAMAEMMKVIKIATAEVIEGETAQVFLGAPPTAPVTINGKVTSGGEPITDGMVAWMPASTGIYEKLKPAAVGSLGAYEVRLDEPGDYIVQISQVGGMTGQMKTVEFNVAVPSDVTTLSKDFELPIGTLAGRVTGPDGEPASGVRVTVMGRGGVETNRFLGGSYAEFETEPDGTFEARWLYPGRYQVAAGGAPIIGDTASAPARIIVGDFNLGADQRIDDIEIELPEAGAIMAMVTTEDGAPVAGATLFLRDSAGRHTELFSARSTGAQGKRLLSGITPGEYTLFARSNDLATSEAGPILVRAGETTETKLIARTATTLTLVLKAGRDEEVPYASVQVLDEKGRDVTRRMAISDLTVLYKDTEFSTRRRRVGPLSPGRYTITARCEDGRSAEVTKTLDGSKTEQRVILRLRQR